MSFDAPTPDPSAVLASASTPIVSLDLELRVVSWNRAAEEVFGWTAEEVLGQQVPFVPEELQAEHHAMLERARAGGAHSVLSRRLRADGEPVDVRVDASCLCATDGTVTGWVHVLHPLQESTSEQEMREHWAKRARMIRRVNEVVVDINTDLDLPSILDRIATSLTSLTEADAGGFAMIEDGRLRLVSMTHLPEHLRDYAAPLETSLFGELLRSGKSVMLATDETRSLDDLIWANLPGLHTIALGVSYVKGEPYGALYALYSGKKVGHVELELLELLAGHAGVALTNALTYQEIERQQAHERVVLDASADGIAVLNRHGHVRKWNRAATTLTGEPADRVVGRRLPFPLPSERGRPLTHQLPNGRWLEILSDRIAESEELVVDFRDVSQSKTLEEQKDLFLATTSHELRTPITVMRGYANTLVERWARLEDANRLEAVQAIASRAGTLARLVENLLLGSHAESAESDLVLQPFDLERVLRSVTTAFAPLSELHRVNVEIPTPLPAAHGDPTATEALVGQLLENAFKYSPEGGEVLVRAVPEKGAAGQDWDGILITVQDEGIGIAPEDHERIFERFVQGETGDRRRFGGVGLGLYITRQLAQAQGGDATAEANRSHGACLQVRLPIAERDAESDASPP
ncbi:PAS domain S-box protein [Lipingzhangella sp. LS1_29]|uniref:histidine kinase n=1 Tax=Lipingzhangella rawalii TaxID=2055835 RepID=A0ABU2H9Z7_9ACTN|nr:PAS domain S-box protein [Lipingzhangella rawalii]MDS1271665.1 PAS domain S-box protein [Lipingzhangella rawalii]